jgi:ATP-binding cassette, subfamily B, multidrug efflux pump
MYIKRYTFLKVERRNLMKINNTKDTLNRIWKYLKKQKTSLILVVVIVIITSILSLIAPYLMGLAIDNILNKDVDKTLKTLMMLLSVFLLNSFFTWLQTYIMVIVSQNTIRDIRKDLFSKFQELSLRFFDKHNQGDLMSRVTNDIDNINAALTQSVVTIMSILISVVGIVIVMFYLNWIMAITSLITIPLIVLITKLIGNYTKKAFEKRQKNLGDLNGYIEETISGAEIITLFGKEEDVLDEFIVKNNYLKESSLKSEILSGIIHPLMNFVNNLGFGVVVLVGGYLTLNGSATIGTITSFVNYSREIAKPLNQVATLYNTILAAIAGSERVFEIMDEVVDIVDKKDAKEVNELKGEVEFKDVSFGYDENKLILKNINLHAKPGQTIAFVGPTGSGKTTIINLLTRFYDINSGEIKIDSLNIQDYKVDSLRKNIGIVLQDTYLFSGTIKDNIRYGRLDATDQEVIEAAKLANAHSFIKHFPNKYNSIISSQGDNLSHGQRQLISIARAILSNPDILILDEATSNIDTRTELHIQSGLNNLMKGRTSFVIAHRLKTIEMADKILVIKDGEIIEQGNHNSLLDKKGFYYGLYVSQFKI